VVSPGIVIRSCAIGEAQAVLDLWKRSGASVSSTDDLDHVVPLIRDWPGSLLVATAGPLIVGSIIAAFDGWRANVYRLVVDPDFRRSGLASSLVARAEADLKARGAKRITALVETDHPLAVSFWQSTKYVRHDAMVRYYGDIETL
jgi:ribosomal protein S18 acetylase RimI-like enzyme